MKLLIEHHLEFLSLKGGCTGWTESTLVKLPHVLEITGHSSYVLSESKANVVADKLGVATIVFRVFVFVPCFVT